MALIPSKLIAITATAAGQRAGDEIPLIPNDPR